MALAMRAVATALCAVSLLVHATGSIAEPQFDRYEIRVIRPRYFVKAAKVELGVGTSFVMNQSFIYSYLATGVLTWHFNEALALEGQFAYGSSFDRSEKRILHDDFDINTVVLRTESMASGRISWTPSYGKYHLTESKVVYFDTFVTAGLGTTGVRYRFDHCEDPGTAPPARVRQYQTFVIGLGQRHFISKSSSFRIGGELQRFTYENVDADCQGSTTPGSKTNDNVILYLGWSKFL